MSQPVIRALSGPADYRSCVELQRLTWGERFSDIVPRSVLMVAQEVGGVAAGAFIDGRLIGFVFGITGWRDGRPIHWSDMLAVHPDFRGRGIGLRLKLHQRETLLAADVRLMRWTFDPLVARNAHLNLRRLGARARSYRRDVYGDSASPLHAGLGTDRLVAEWELDSERVRRRIAGDVDFATLPDPAGLPACNPPTGAGAVPRPGAVRIPASADAVGLVVPRDILSLREREPELALAWRHHVREAFETLFGAGYEAVDVAPAPNGLASYVLTRALRR